MTALRSRRTRWPSPASALASPVSAGILLLLATAAAAPAQQPPDEAIWSDYRNVRSLNYLAADGTGGIANAASSTAMWYYYSAPLDGSTTLLRPQVNGQLAMQKAIGCNTIRVWLSFPMWKYHRDFTPGPNPYLADLEDFMDRCANEDIWVMPVFWGSTGNFLAEIWPDPPVQTEALATIDKLRNGAWHGHPGLEYMQRVMNASSFAASPAAAFVTEVVDHVRTNCPEALLMWDVFNEPGNDALHDFWISGTLNAINSAYGTATRHPTTVGNAWNWSDPYFAGLGNDPLLDVLGIHIYTMHREGVAGMIADIAAQNFGKPVLLSEIGAMGLSGLKSSKGDKIRCARSLRPAERPPPERLMLTHHRNWMGSGAPVYPGMAFIDGYRFFEPPFVGPYVYNPGWMWTDSWRMSLGLSDWRSLIAGGWLPGPASQSHWMEFISTFDYSVIESPASTPAGDAYRMAPPDVAKLRSPASEAEYTEHRERLLNRIGILERWRRIMTNQEAGHEQGQYVVPSHGVHRGAYVSFGKNLVRNPGAEFLRTSPYRRAEDPQPCTQAHDPLDGPVGKPVAAWSFAENRTATADPFTAQSYSAVPSPQPWPTANDYRFFGRNTAQAFSASQVVPLADLTDDFLTAQRTYNASGWFWAGVWMRVEFLSRDGRVVGTERIGTPASTNAWVQQAPVAANVPFNASSVRVTLEFEAGSRGVGGADNLAVVINP